MNAVFAKDLSPDLFLDVTVGNEIIDVSSSTVSTTGTGLTILGLNDVSNASTVIASNGLSQSRIVGFYGAAHLAYKDMLFVDVTARQDHVSYMPRGNRAFFYPSIGLGFVFTDALGMESNKILNSGKLRLSYAQVGNASAVGAYDTKEVFLPAAVGTGFTNDGIAFPFNSLAGFQRTNVLRDKNLTPENQTNFEFGLDFEFMQGRIGLELTYFDVSTKDQIFTVPISASSGYTSFLTNAGELESKGFEVTLNANLLKLSNGFSWDLSANFSKIDNNVISLADGVPNIFLGGFTEPNIRAEAGASYPIIFGSRFARDDNGNIVVDSRQQINGNPNANYGMPLVASSNGTIGQANPDWLGGITNTFRYKGVTVSVQVDIREGGQAYAGNTKLQKLYGMDAVTEDRTTPTVLNASKGYYDQNNELVVEGTNDIAIVKGQQYWLNAMDAIDESNVYDNSFIRLREVMVSYNLPSKLFSANSIIKGGTVFVSGRNLLLITDYPNFDPETTLGGASNFQGLEYVNLPQTRTLGGGVRLKF